MIFLFFFFLPLGFKSKLFVIKGCFICRCTKKSELGVLIRTICSNEWQQTAQYSPSEVIETK